MKKLYWRPQRISLRVLSLIAAVAVIGQVALESYRTHARQPYYDQKLAAARTCQKAFEAVKEARRALGHAIDPESDLNGSGMLGVLMSPTTTDPGHLPAKQTAANPNWAAVVVHMLGRAGVTKGDVVALGVSGSFPTLNIAALAAVHAVGAEPILISSVGASQFGANIPDLTWLDMESVIAKQGILPFRSVAATRGGIDDRGFGMSKKGKELLDEAMRRNGIEALETKNATDGVDKRMAIYRARAAGRAIKAYINVGGGTASLGSALGRRLFKPGLSKSVPRGGANLTAVMSKFATEGVPIIHLSKIELLAERYGLPVSPTTPPAIGEGKVFARAVYNPWIAGVMLVLLILLMIAFVRMDWGYRLVSAAGARGATPEPMV